MHLPEGLGCVPCRRHVHPQQASAPAALLVSGACDPAFIDCVRQGACGKGLGQVRCSTRRAMRPLSYTHGGELCIIFLTTLVARCLKAALLGACPTEMMQDYPLHVSDNAPTGFPVATEK